MKLRSSRIKLKKSPIFKEKLNMQIYNSFKALNLKDKISAVKSLLNRPIRVCGMVKNEEPGGGPYWVTTQNNVVLYK
jgi:hypothetical protein